MKLLFCWPKRFIQVMRKRRGVTQKVCFARIVLSFLYLSLSSCAHAPEPIKSDSYIFNFSPNLDGKTYVFLSADGNAVAGITDQKFIWLWTPQSGTINILTEPENSQQYIAVNADGSVVAGVFESEAGSSNLFLWSAKDGLKMIPALPPDETIEAPFHLSDDGKTVTFYCFMTASLTTSPVPCNQAPFLRARYPMPLKTWSQPMGFQNYNAPVDGAFDYIRMSGDMITSLMGKNGSWSYAGKPHLQNGPELMISSADGKIVPLDPPPFDVSPGDEDVGMVGIVSNDELSVVSAPAPRAGQYSIWNSSGELMPKFRLPRGCSDFSPDAIDGQGTIFGRAICPGTIEGLRISASKTQTIADWLKSGGLDYPFPKNIVVWKVSDSGKTVVGIMDSGVAMVGESAPVESKKTGSNESLPPFTESGFVPWAMFVAHIQ